MTDKNERRYIFLGMFFMAVIFVFSVNGWGAKLLASLIGVSGKEALSETPGEDFLYYEYPLFDGAGRVYDIVASQIKTSFDRNGRPEPIIQVGSKFYTKSILAGLPRTDVYEQSSVGDNSSVGEPAAATMPKNTGDSLSLDKDKIDLDFNWADENDWTAEDKVTLVNLKDSPLAYDVSFKCCGLGENKTAQGVKASVTESHITMDPKSIANLELNIAISKNSDIPNGRYNGFLEISSKAENFTVPVSFFKGYGVRVYYSGGTPSVLSLYKNSLTEIFAFPGNNNDSTIFYLTETGPWSLQGVWNGDDDAIVKHVIKSDIQTNRQPVLNFTLNKSDATHEVAFNLTKPSGAAFKYTPPFVYKISHRSSGHGFNVIIPAGLAGNQIKLKVSDINSGYNFSGVASYGDGNNLAVYLYQLANGILSNKTITNDASDFTSKELVSFQNDFSKRTSFVFVGDCNSQYKSNGDGGYACAYFSNQNMGLPASGAKKLFVFNSNSSGIATAYPDYPSFNVLLASDTGKDFFDKSLARSDQYYVNGNDVYGWLRNGFNFFALRPEKSPTSALYIGSGLEIDTSRWQNFANKTIKLIGFSSGGEQATYSLKKGSVAVLSGSLKPGETVSLPTQSAAGSYEFLMERDVVMNNVITKTVINSTFNIMKLNNAYLSRPVDENPPALTRLSITADGFLQNVIDTTLSNVLTFTVDPVPGLRESGLMQDSLNSVKLEVMSNDVNWRERSLTDLGNGRYSAVVNVHGDPTPPGFLYSFRISAKDAAENGLVYTFQVPTGVGLKDRQSPDVFLSLPSAQSFFGGNINLQAQATDNMKVSKVELYNDGVLVDAKATAPYNFIWDTIEVADGSHVLQAKAYDLAGNVGESSMLSITVDNTPPEIVIDSPSENSVVLGTIVNIFGSASDNEKVKKIDFYLNENTLVGSDDTFPYILNWDSTAIPDGKHTITAKAYDLSGNTTVSKAVTLRVENTRKPSRSSSPTSRPPTTPSF